MESEFEKAGADNHAAYAESGSDVTVFHDTAHVRPSAARTGKITAAEIQAIAQRNMTNQLLQAVTPRNELEQGFSPQFLQDRYDIALARIAQEPESDVRSIFHVRTSQIRPF